VARQPIAGDGLARVNGKDAALEIAQFGEDKLRRLGPRQDGARLGEEQGASLGQLDAAADPVEKFCAVPSFQRSDRGADSRLSDVKRLGGARDMLAFRDGDEDPEVFERHGLTLSGQDRPRLNEDRREGPCRSAFSSSRAARGASISEAGSPDSRQSPGRPSRRLAPRTYSASSRPRPAKRRGIGEAAPEPCRRNDRSDSCC
jgi:hypothetical protein